MAQDYATNLMPVKKSWYKQPWFIAIVIFLILWFGLPLILNLFGASLFAPKPAARPGVYSLPKTDFPRSRLETADDPSKGSPMAPVVIVEFGDFQCPFCRESVPIIKQVLQEYPEAVRLIYRDFPVSAIHTEAISAAEAANCAHKQGAFWNFHDALFARQENLGRELYLALAESLKLNLSDFKRCLDNHLTLAEIQADFSDGAAAQVTGTPSWFINGRKVEGTLTIELWRQVIDSVIREEFASRPGG
jgi:protein-disulfide isomerase